MSNIVASNSTFQQFNSLSQLHIVRQLGFMLITAAGIALGTAIILWSTSPAYTALYPDMSTQDSSEMIAVLEGNGTPYKINSSNGLLTVPSDQVQEIRLQLASDGLPSSSNNGFGILENEQSLGTSNFIEQARFNLALEQELVETIKHIKNVRDARIHLSIPKQSSFIRNSSNPSASVMLDLVGQGSLNDSQLMGIAHLVSSSVAGLASEDVSIVDQFGSLLSRDSKSEFGNSNENVRFTRGIESDYSQRIIDILTPIVGVGNVRAQVSADLDFTFIETTEEIFNPNTVIRSQQIQEENSGTVGSSGAAPVEPGTLSATPPTGPVTAENGPEQTSSNTQSRINSTHNYEIDRTVNLIRSVPGTVNRLSVAVLVNLHPDVALPISINENPAGEDGEETEGEAVEVADTAVAEAPAAVDTSLQDAERIARLTTLVRDAIGYDEARGDSINVINETFFKAAAFIPTEALPIWQESWVHSLAKQIGAGLVVILLIFCVLRPAMKSVVSNQNNLPVRGAARLSDQSALEVADDTVSLSNQSETLALASMPGESAYNDNLQLAQELVKNEPAKAARMIKNWVASD